MGGLFSEGCGDGWNTEFQLLMLLLLLKLHLLLLFLLHLQVLEQRVGLLKEQNGSLGSEGLLLRRGRAGSRLPVGAKSRGGDIGLVAAAAHKRTLIVVQSFVEFKVNVLREAGAALVAAVRLLAGVESHVRLQVGGRAEPFSAFDTRVRLLT